MSKKILLLLSVSLLSVALFAQKKTGPAKAAKVVHPVVKKVVLKIPAARMLRLSGREEARESLVTLKNESHLLPLERLDTLSILVVSIGMGSDNPLPQLIGRYIKADYRTIVSNAKGESIGQNIAGSAPYNLMILALGEQREDPILPESMKQLAGNLPLGAKSMMILFGNQPFLEQMVGSVPASAIVVTGKADYDRTDLVTQLIFGGISAGGKLPFDLAPYKKGDGITYPSIHRLSYALPEEVGIDSLRLSQRMDSLVDIGLKAKAFPGCQLILAKKGKIFWMKSYGFHTYDHSLPVQNDDIYDLASVTKVLAPVPALMMLADQKKFIVSKKMSDYWPDWKGSNKEGIVASDLLSHQARLKSGVTLWPGTMDETGRYSSLYYSMQPKQGYDLRVSGNLYLINSYPDSVYKAIRDSRLLKTKKYEYSDLGFVILPKVIETLSGESYETFLHRHLYAKLGATSLRYNPYLSEPTEKIVPTEDDQIFRHELLQGFVHDETAALLGGVSGNAGLFGSAGDVAKVMQLYLQNGMYGNERYITAETLENWTSSHFKKTNNRRGFGFDKPGIQMNRYTGKERYPSKVVSEQSYGHSGYTGTFVWADPANELLFVFLSNRVYPGRDNHKINKLKLRPLLLENFFKLAGEK